MKDRLASLVQCLYGNIIRREELAIYEAEFAWFLNVDILVLDELQLSQLDYIGLAVRSAFLDLQLPQVSATM